MKKHICRVIYEMCGSTFCIGDDVGNCVVTGEKSVGLKFEDWVSARFTDYASLRTGTIISNEAAQCFDESSAILQKKVNADKPQRFRNYSHVITKDGEWLCLSKAEKGKILQILLDGCDEYTCITSTGKKHILFKTLPNRWNFDGLQIEKDVSALKKLSCAIHDLLSMNMTKNEIYTGQYTSGNLSKEQIGLVAKIDSDIKPLRRTPLFMLAIYLTQKSNSDE